MRSASAGFLRSAAIRKLRPATAVDRKIPRAREDRAWLQPIKPADRMGKMRRIRIADVLREMREVDVLVGEIQEMPRPLPSAEGAEGDAGLLLEQMQEARGRKSSLHGAGRRRY